MIVTLILIVVSVGSLAGLLLVASNASLAAEAAAASNAVYSRKRITGCGPGLIAFCSAVAIVGLWTWYAVAIHDWRFAALAWVQILATVIRRAILKGASTA